MRFCNERTIVFHRKGKRGESTMKISEIHMKIIAIGLLPVFLILALALPNTTSTAILLGGVMFTAFVVSFIGMRMQKKDAKDDDDLLAIPPKK
jgi:4-hydroxybenzoate polyprenyltransferase